MTTATAQPHPFARGHRTPASSHDTVLADALAGRRSLAKDAALVTASIAVVAVLAQIEIPLWPVPITGQTLGVMLVAASLGFRRGTAALAGYLVLGLAGAPVFAGFTGSIAAVGKPSFGFVIGFVATAAVVGALAERRWDRRPLLAIALFGLASLIPFAFGIPYMAAMLAAMGTPVGIVGAIELGFVPFVLGGAVKWAIAAALMPAAWAAVRARG